MSATAGAPACLRRAFLLTPALVFIVVLVVRLLPIPAFQQFSQQSYSVTITDRDGVVLTVVPLADGSWRQFTALDDLPPTLVDIFRKSEDERFFAHPGVDPLAVLRAAIDNAQSGTVVSGGSTITMQLASIIRPSGPGMLGKVAEAVGAVRLELALSKAEILEHWLNSLPFGYATVGVTSAAITFFGTPVDQLSLEQMLLLAVIPRRPASLAPTEHPAAAAAAAGALAERIGLVIDMDVLQVAADRARDDAAAWQRPQRAPHFTRFVAARLSDADRASGAPITTTLSVAVQEAAEAAVRARVASAAANRITNGAALVIDNHSGEILAYVGSADFFDTEHDGQIDGVQILRQPGSTIKPFLYALALDNGFTPATILPDIESEFGGAEIYVPQNFNRRFNGPVRVRTALASSLNVPAVHMLERLGVQNFAAHLIRLGFDSIAEQKQRVGIGLALGNAEVRLWELVRAFAAFPRDGVPVRLRWHVPAAVQTTDTGGAPISRYAAGAIRDILSDTVGRVAGFGMRSVLDTPFEAMFKTGTSNQFNNIWALGSTAEMTVGVWMGNFSGATVVGTPGSSLPAAAVVEILSLFAEPGSALPPIRDAHAVEICALSGMAAGDHCTATLTEYFPTGTTPTSCTWHVGFGVPVRYPAEYAAWAADRHYRFQALVRSEGTVEITHPSDGARFYVDPLIPPADQAVRIEAVSPTDEVIQLRLNDAFIAEGTSPLRAYVTIAAGEYRIHAMGEHSADEVWFLVR